MILDDYVSHIDFNLNNSNGRYNDFTIYSKFVIPKNIFETLKTKYNITLDTNRQYGFISNNDFFIIISNNFNQNINNNAFKLSNTKKDLQGQDYCVSSSLINSAIIINKKDMTLNVTTMTNPCLPLPLLNNYLYNYYTDLKVGYGRSAFVINNSYIDDLMTSNRSSDIITGILYFLIPVLIVIFLIKVFRKGIH